MKKLLVLLSLLIVTFFTFGVYNLEPIEAAPEGETFIYWRFGTELHFYKNAENGFIMIKDFSRNDIKDKIIVKLKIVKKVISIYEQ